MGFVFQPYLSRGSNTPCVARTMLQTAELASAFPLPESAKKDLAEISHDVMLKLIACLDAAEPIIAQVAAGAEKIRAGDIPIGSGGQSIQLPAVVDLRAKAETFLYNAKLALREIARLFAPFHNQNFDHRFQRIRAWATETYGPDDPLTAQLGADAQWIERVIGMRNAVDHPGSGDGTLTVDNFRLLEPGPPLNIGVPSWQRDNEAPVSIAEDMQVIMDDLLTLYEDILIDGLERSRPDGPFVIYEVPEGERDAAQPIRFRVGLRAPLPGS